MAVTERITIEGDEITVSLIVWRRFKRPMPGLVERVYDETPGLADLGQFLPVGTTLNLPIPQPRSRVWQDPVKLW